MLKTSFGSCWQYLEKSLGLGDHVSQSLGGSQVLTQVSLVRAAQAVLPVTGPTANNHRSKLNVISF